ncbi:hypothetical protein [Paenibacillus humicola]|uniref:hypothetical protein n=1 Tax=Paenibacillus humicola TaxID=3110540 RepID=UPI00237ACCC4|nr:hypothetical protein [Paenibacillus humicola]
MNKRWLQMIGVKIEDRRKLVLMTPVFLLCGIAEMLNYNGYMTLFNERLGSAYLPYVYTAEAVILPLEAWFMSWLTGRLTKPELMRTMFAAMGGIVAFNAAVLLVMRAAGTDISWYYPFLFLTSSFVVRQQTILLWSLAVDLCPTQQAKRLMPVFVSGAALGGIVSGLLARAISGWFGADAVYMVAPLFLLAGSFNYRRAIAQYLVPLTLKAEQGAAGPSAESGLGSADYFKRSFTSPYLLVAIGIMTLMPGLYFLMEYEFLNVSQTIFTSEADFASFFGLVTTLLFAAAFLLQLVSGRIMAWLGPSNMLAAIAAVFTAGFALAGATLGTPAVLLGLSAGYMFLYLLLYYFAEPANQLFFKLLPISQRDGYRYVAQGVSASAGILIGALLQSLHAGFGLPLSLLAWLGAGGSALLVLLALLGRRLYIRELLRSVQTMTAAGHDAAAALDEFLRQGRSSDLLGRLLEHPNDYTREVALGLIGRTKDASFLPRLLGLADDRSARIRLASLRAMNLASAELQAVVKVASFLEDPDYEVRAEAVRLLGRVTHMPHQAVYFVRLKLLDSHPMVVAEAVKSLYALQNAQSFEACYEVVERFLREGGEAAIYMCRAIAELNMYSFLPAVEPLLGEFNPAVRAEAIACMGRLRHIAAVPWLQEMLEWAEPALHEATVEAFVRMGEGAVLPLTDSLPLAPPKVWSAAMRALARLTDEPQADAALADASLFKIGEWKMYRQAEAALRALGQRDGAELAGLRLKELMFFVADGIWAVLERLADEEVVRAVRLAAEDRDEETRESGLEALSEGLGDKRLSGALVRLLTGGDEEAGELAEEEALNVLRRTAGMRDAWLQLIASAVIQQREANGMEEQRSLFGMLDKIVFLKQVPFFTDLTLEQLGYIAGIAAEETVQAGERLVKRGEPNSRLGVIVEGHVQLIADADGGEPLSVAAGTRDTGGEAVRNSGKMRKEAAAAAGRGAEFEHAAGCGAAADSAGHGLIAVLGPKDVFGETSALDGTPATTTVLAAGGEVRLLALSGEELSRLVRLHPEIGMGLLRASLARVRMLERTIATGGVF